MLILSFHSQLAAAIISLQNDTDRATASTAEWKTISKRKLSGRVRKARHKISRGSVRWRSNELAAEFHSHHLIARFASGMFRLLLLQLHSFFFRCLAEMIASPSIKEMAFAGTSVRDGRSAPTESNLDRTSDKVRKRPREEKSFKSLFVWARGILRKY